MSIMDFFRSGNSNEQAADSNASSQQQTAPAKPATPAAPAAPNAQMPGTNQEPVNPLDAYAKLFEKSGNEDTPPSLNLDPAVLSDVSSKLNFTQDVSPELMQKATNGDMGALIDIMNKVGQNSYKASLAHNSALTDKFVGARTAHAMKGVGSTVRSELTNNALSTTPNYNHPVVKRQLDETARSFGAQYPDATPDEIARMSIQYINDLASAVSPKQQSKEEQAAKDGIDWDKYFNG